MVDISVVIPCYNGAETLERQLTAIARQRTSYSFEVRVADNMSTDSSAAIIREWEKRDPRFQYVSAFERQGINHARNSGVLHSSGRLILLCDADDVVQDGWIEAYGRAFEGGADLMGGPLRLVDGGELVGIQADFVGSPWVFKWPYGANCGFSRTFFDALDGFDESYLGGGDETDFFWRAQLAGGKLVLVPDAWIEYHSRGSARSAYRQKLAYGRAEVKLYVRFRRHGMRRQSLVRAPIAVLVALAGIAFDVPGRKRHAARLGRNLGRILGSFKHRVIYL